MDTPKRQLRFCGKWQLLVDRSDYEFGAPPVSGVCAVEPSGDDMFITVDWTDSCGHEYSARYTITPDGQEYAHERPEAAESVMTRFADTDTLETFAVKGGQVAVYTKRVVDEDGNTMVVTQQSHTSDGQMLCNVQHYRRIGE